jgi:phosphate starvation-inducible PhoH-like protein
MYIGYKVIGAVIMMHSILPPVVCRSLSRSPLSRSASSRAITMRLKSKGKHDDATSLISSPLMLSSSSSSSFTPGSYTLSQWKYKPRSENQIKYVDYLIDPNITIVGGFGPAGTGKTLFACHAAIGALKGGLVDKIVITRPLIAVDEEELGFLPGSIANKMDPWTRPIFDILGEFYTANQVQTMVKNGVIEISPLAYMRGRTFKRAFIIADEMQNSSPNQMLMMLTRIGEASKLVITGDLKQSDRSGVNGLVDFIGKLSADQNRCTSAASATATSASSASSASAAALIKFVELENVDIQRSAVVARVLDIYAASVASAAAAAAASKRSTDAAIIPKGYDAKSYTL